MGTKRAKPQWRAVGESVRGAAHVRAGLPNQDAIHWLPASGAGPPLILTVSDGHGSAKYFRSNVGSKLAAERAAWVIQDLLDGQPDPANLSAIKRTAFDRLPHEIVRSWREAVEAHLQQTPLTPDELGTLEGREDAAARESIAANPLRAYGATALAALVAETFILYLQLGDGDILLVSESGEVTRPMQRDERLFANQTTSLCSTDAWHDVQIHFQALVGPPPALILLASDGYANSFVNEAAFLQVGVDMLDMIRADGLAAVQGNLATWLDEASQAGSGDDITLGLLCRSGIEFVPKAGEGTELPDVEDDEFVWKVTTHIARVKKDKGKQPDKEK